VSAAQATVRLQQKVEELCSAAIRALAGEGDLHFRDRRLHRGERRLPFFAPHLRPSLERDDFGSFRGAADGLALRLRLSDAELHRRLQTEDPLERLIFEMLEQYRVESLAELPGVRHNLRHCHERWSLSAHRDGLTETATGVLLYTVSQICRSRVTGEPVIGQTEDLIEATRAAIVPTLGHDLAGLRRQRADQAAYAEHALGIARAIAAMVRAADPSADRRRERADDDDRSRALFRIWVDAGGEEGGSIATAGAERSVAPDAAAGGYRAFTIAYDREAVAASLVRPAALQELRKRLDALFAGQGLNVPRLARELKALLATPERDDWDSAQEAGRIDGRRLAQLIATPTERRLFRTERHEPIADCVVAFLIDCSGSMKQHIEPVALLIDTFVRALEQAGVASEVLGFTTGSWNGGRALRDWQRAGRPSHPGRLNEVCHLVFKGAETPWRRARRNIAALLKADLFREGIDGEAVDWACSRLAAGSEARRLLLVVSDGCPMDTATNLANDERYLDRHLRAVAARWEQSGLVEVFGIGVGLDLSPYYRRSQLIELAGSLRNVVFQEILALIAGRRSR
jgi:cobaltochelatase CobT